MSEQQGAPQVEPIDLLRTKASNLSTTLDGLCTKASVKDIFSALESIDSQLGALPGQLAQCAHGATFSTTTCGSVQQVKESDTGALLFHKDHLELTFGAQSNVRAAHFILKGDSAEWLRLINRVNAGEMEKDRVGTQAAPAAEKPKTMPTQCAACGARFTPEIVRGMNSLKCQFCGTVVQL